MTFTVWAILMTLLIIGFTLRMRYLNGQMRELDASAKEREEYWEGRRWSSIQP